MARRRTAAVEIGQRVQRTAAVVGALAFLILPCAALAQDGAVSGAAPAAQAGGNGIKVGEGRVHPFFDLELRFDSAAVSAAGAGNFPELLAHFRPGLRLEVPGSVVSLNMAGDVDFVWYTGLLTDTSYKASHLEGGVNLDAAFNHSGPVEFRLRDDFRRSDRTENPAIGVGILSLYNQVGAGVPIHPGGGALEVTPGASFTFEFFEPILTTLPGGIPDTGSPSQFNYTSVGFQLNARYKFLPKTALVLDSSFDLPQFSDGNNPMLLNATIGLSGLVSQKIAVVAKVGWGHNFKDNVAKTVVGHVELSYLASQTASLKVGYLRSLNPIALYSIYGDDRGYVEGRALLGGRFTLHGYTAFDYISYYSARNADLDYTLDLGPQFQFTPWLVGAGGYVLTVRSSGIGGPASYTRHEGYVRLTLQY